MPNDRPPAATPPAPDALPWDAFEQLASNELPENEAQALRAQIDSEPAWAAAYARVTTVQQALAALRMQAVPLGLVRGVMRELAVPARRPLRWPHIAAGWAAAILICVMTWYAVDGTTPELGTTQETWVAQAPAPEWLAVSDDASSWHPVLPIAAAKVPSPDAWVWLVAGLLLLGFGLSNAIRMHRAARDGRVLNRGAA